MRDWATEFQEVQKGQRKALYEQYLASPEWAERRRTALQRASYECQLCPATETLQVHHRLYDRCGAEHPRDLTVLCCKCHARHHGKGKPRATKQRTGKKWHPKYPGAMKDVPAAVARIPVGHEFTTKQLANQLPYSTGVVGTRLTALWKNGQLERPRKKVWRRPVEQTVVGLQPKRDKVREKNDELHRIQQENKTKREARQAA